MGDYATGSQLAVSYCFLHKLLRKFRHNSKTILVWAKFYKIHVGMKIIGIGLPGNAA